VRSIVTDFYAEQGGDPTMGAPLLGTLEALEPRTLWLQRKLR
jgi:hypothetical protein